MRFPFDDIGRRGYDVTAIEIDGQLLRELKEHVGPLPITTIEADLRWFPQHVQERVELVVCMVDTLLAFLGQLLP